MGVQVSRRACECLMGLDNGSPDLRRLYSLLVDERIIRSRYRTREFAAFVPLNLHKRI